MYVYRYQNRTQPFYGGPVNRGLHGLGAANYDVTDLQMMESADAGGGGGGGNSTISDIGNAILHIGQGAAAVYGAQRGTQAKPGLTIVPPTAHPGAGLFSNMSTTTKLVLGGVALFLLAPLAMKAFRR